MKKKYIILISIILIVIFSIFVIFITTKKENIKEDITLKTGSEINAIMKELSGDSGVGYNGNDIVEKIVIDKWNPKYTILHGLKWNSGISAGSNNAQGAKLFYKSNTIYLLYKPQVKLYLNEDSSSLMEGFTSLTAIDGLNKLNTSKVTDMSAMFSNCDKLTSLNLSNFDTSNVTDMSSMFEGCEKLTSLDLSNFDTLNVCTMRAMFSTCKKLTSLDLSKFNTSNVIDMSFMFDRCISLNTIKVNPEKFITTNVIDSVIMFNENIFLVGGNGTEFDSNYNDKTYAKVDTKESKGYFTE